jgi:copper oxidase (laccase) domain-containing protein
VHGDLIATVPDGADGGRVVRGVDGLVTKQVGVALGIYVADCAAVFLADRVTGALALVHSGKKGTDLGIAGQTVERMGREAGTRPADLEVAISPCIRPPHYEEDFLKALEEQLHGAGVPREQVSVSGECTGAKVGQYYSYRIEKGKTGRMLALLGRIGEDSAP